MFWKCFCWEYYFVIKFKRSKNIFCRRWVWIRPPLLIFFLSIKEGCRTLIPNVNFFQLLPSQHLKNDWKVFDTALIIDGIVVHDCHLSRFLLYSNKTKICYTSELLVDEVLNFIYSNAFNMFTIFFILCIHPLLSSIFTSPKLYACIF